MRDLRWREWNFPPMQKIYRFDPRTRMLYFGAVLVLVMVAGFSILAGLGAASQPYYRGGRDGMTLVGVGLLFLLAAGAPLKGWLRGRRSQVVVTLEELIYEDDGAERRIAWGDILDLSEMSTYLEIGLRDKGGSLQIPNSFEDFPDLIEEIRARARIRSW